MDSAELFEKKHWLKFAFKNSAAVFLTIGDYFGIMYRAKLSGFSKNFLKLSILDYKTHFGI